jgi:hypothetical protein
MTNEQKALKVSDILKYKAVVGEVAGSIMLQCMRLSSLWYRSQIYAMRHQYMERGVERG